MRAHNSFSLIELMIVIAIVALLASVAVPSYKAYITRSQAVQGLNILEAFKTQVQLNYTQFNAFPTTLSGIVFSSQPSYMANGTPIGYIYSNTGGWAKISTTISAEFAYGTYGWLTLAVIINPSTGVFTWYCGAWDGTYFTASNLPSGCLPTLGTTPGGLGSSFWSAT